MQKKIQFFTKIVAVLAAAVLTSVAVADRYTADQYAIPKGSTLSWKSGIVSAKDSLSSEENTMQLMLFQSIPVKTVQVSTPIQKSVILCGTPFGIRMFTNGVMVVDMAQILTHEGAEDPAQEAGIQIGDIIVSINGENVYENGEIAEQVESSNGEPMNIELKRGSETMSVTLHPVLSKVDNTYKAGMWVRDSTAGIGTLTFYDQKSQCFGGLGHGICDADTYELMPLRTGDILPVTISGVTKGMRGTPGELRGYFSDDEAIGSLGANTSCGVFGMLEQEPEGTVTQIGLKQGVQTGEVQILTTIDNEGPKYYSAVIESINYHGDQEGKNFVLRITDSKLLEKTGGIVQGMSGSPIIQNGKLIGAVTHVFVNDPTRGYGIFAENMLNQSNTVSNIMDSLNSAA